ncbi:hypothetical protein MKK64_12465 [Methylobacterium sp. E-025]|uniref:hypothetical protein n=1 Tax=Methylobacterium sp. E-025 TaxID=2836561 RepID=UPI001FB8CB3E|nr:hypothetical protein [Methylobacterium sp. E-025]MCJ2112003.1 hypothetical protein [Methylobacterium sp. E-025]
MPKRIGRRYTTFLVAVTADAATSMVPASVYAVMARRPDEALEIVRAQADGSDEVVVVGSLSSRMAKAIRLSAGEMRAI